MINNLIAIDSLHNRSYRYSSFGGVYDLRAVGLTIKTISPTVEQLEQAIVVYVGPGFNVQSYDGSVCQQTFYIPKFKTVYTLEQLKKCLEEHSDSLFMLVTDEKGEKANVWSFIDSVDNKLKIVFFQFNVETGSMAKIGSIENVTGTCQWDDNATTLDKKFLKAIYTDEDSYSHIKKHHLKFVTPQKNAETGSYYTEEVDRFYIVGFDDFDNSKFRNHTESFCSSAQIMLQSLKLPGHTRIVSSVNYGCIDYEVSICDRAMQDITSRYGFYVGERRDYYTHHIHTDIEFDADADLDETTWERIKNYLTKKLLDGQGKSEQIGSYNNRTNITTKDIVVISGPIGAHRRPVYHYIKAFMNVGVVDVVELVRGELLMKDMTPVDAYYLNGKTGKYCKVSHTNYSDAKNKITKAEIDHVSFTEWSESKSLHPQLLKAISDAGEGAIRLSKIRLFNRIPFGALFLEHLIKGTQYELAENFASYITERADNMNYTCGSLGDLLPGCNPDGTSLMKVLNLNKPCYDLLMTQNKDSSNVDDFLAMYQAINRIVPDGILTKERQKLYEEYMDLKNDGWARYHCRTDRTVDIIDYPEEIKSIYKMRNKIKKIASSTYGYGASTYELLRHYREIVNAYFQFKDFGWDPGESQIFIEFGMGDPAQTASMMTDREHAANTALEIYKNKIDELAHQKAEKQYAHRKTNLKKLTSSLDKVVALKNYVVLAPSQIYGEEVVGSIEKEGHDMEHCVYRSYAGEIAAGTYTVLYLRSRKNPEDSLVTIGITKEGRINQTFGKYDERITKEQAMAIAAWAKAKTGLVTFKSEHTNVTPGGWDSSVEIPDLPEPNKDWLKKLASVE